MNVIFIAKQIKINTKDFFKSLNNPKLGVSVKISNVILHGTFQKDWIHVKITISDYVVGKSCNGTDYHDNLLIVKEIVLTQYKDYFTISR